MRDLSRSGGSLENRESKLQLAGNSESVVRRSLDPDLAPHELAQLIRKLRWARLEQEAEQLELIMSSFPQEQRGTVSAGPFSTD